jgi:hypothetical protein
MQMSTDQDWLPFGAESGTSRSHSVRAGSRRKSDMSLEGPATAPEPMAQETPSAGAAEATLSLEPLRAPITTMVQNTLVAEREALARMSEDLRNELDRLRDWQTREELLRADQTAQYRRAADEWHAVTGQATVLRASVDILASVTRELHSAVEVANARLWHRAMVAAAAVALVGLGLVVALCGVVWLALTTR